jgi:hypothetical protein
MLRPFGISSFSLLRTDSRSEANHDQLLPIKVIIRKIACEVSDSAQDHDWNGANHSLDPQDTQVCSSCLSELGAVRQIGFPNCQQSQTI